MLDVLIFRTVVRHIHQLGYVPAQWT